MAYVIGVMTPEGFREIWSETLEEHRQNLDFVNKNKWRIKYSASGKFARENNEFLQKSRLKAEFGKDYEKQFQEPVGYYEAGKEVPVSSGVAEKLGLISKEEVESNKEAIYVVRKSDIPEVKMEKTNQIFTPVSLETTLPKPTSGTATTLFLENQEITLSGEVKKTKYKEPIAPELNEGFFNFGVGLGLGLTSRFIPPVGMYFVGKGIVDVGKSLGTGIGTSIAEKNINPLKENIKEIGKGFLNEENIGFMIGYGAHDIIKKTSPKSEIQSKGIGTIKFSIRKPNIDIKTPVFERTYIQSYGEPYIISKKIDKLSIPAKSEKMKLSDTINDNLWKIDKTLDDALKEKYEKTIKIETTKTDWFKETMHIKIEPVIEFKESFFGLVKKQKYIVPERDIFSIKEFEAVYPKEKKISIGTKTIIDVLKTEKGLGYKERVDVLAIKDDMITIDTRNKKTGNKGYVGDFYENPTTRSKTKPKIFDVGKIFSEKESRLDKLYGKNNFESGLKLIQKQKSINKNMQKLEIKPTKLIQKQNNSILQISPLFMTKKINNKQKYENQFKFGLFSNLEEKQTQKYEKRTVPRFYIEQILKIRSPTTRIRTPEIPIIPELETPPTTRIRTPEIPIIPELETPKYSKFKFPNMNFGFKEYFMISHKIYRQPKKYQPSLAGVLLKIKSPKSFKRRKLFTGFEVRGI